MTATGGGMASVQGAGLLLGEARVSGQVQLIRGDALTVAGKQVEVVG